MQLSKYICIRNDHCFNMAENWSNVSGFTASLNKAFHMESIFGKQLNLLLSTITYADEMSVLPSGNKRVVDHAYTQG